MNEKDQPKIGSIGSYFGPFGASALSLGGSENWHEYDALYFDLEGIIESYKIVIKAMYSADDAKAMQLFQRHSNQRLAEFSAFLNSGKTIFVSPAILPEMPFDERGNAKRTPAFLKYPWEELKARKLSGNTGGDPATQSANDVYGKLLGLFGHEYTISRTLGQPIAYAVGTQEPIASIQTVGNGQIIYLPKPKLTRDQIFDRMQFDLFCSHLSSILTNKLTVDGLGELPEWANAISWPELDRAYQFEAQLNEKISDLKAKLSECRSIIDSERKYRNLLAGTGKALESAAKSALVELGLKIESELGNQADVIGFFEGRLFVFEVKGVSGSATQKHCRQLLQWMSTAEERFDALSKGILVIVPFRDVPIKARSSPVFPPNVVELAKKRGLCLVTGDKLLSACVHARANPESAKHFLKSLNDTDGVLEIADTILKLNGM